MEQDERAPLGQWPEGVSSPEIGIRLGRALAADRKRVVVATDMARSSRMMCEALIAGLLSQGADVVDGGIAPEPAVAYAARKGDCAVFVKEEGAQSRYVVFNQDGSPFTKEQVRHTETSLGGTAAPDYAGIGNRLEYGRAAEEYADRLESELGKTYKSPTAIDCRCGTAALVAPRVIGSNVISIDGHPDRGQRSAEDPLDADGLSNLIDIVKAEDGYIGAGFDRSGSRAVIIDEEGRIVTRFEAAAMVVSHLRPKKVVASADTSSLVEKACAEAEYLIASCDAGSVAEKMAKEDADIGICEDGLMYRGLPAPDPFRTAAILSEIAYSDSLNRMCLAMPVHYWKEESLPIGEDLAAFTRGMNEILNEMQTVRVSAADGWRVDLESGWFLIRKPADGRVQVLAESTDKAYLVGLMETASDLVRASSHHQ